MKFFHLPPPISWRPEQPSPCLPLTSPGNATHLRPHSWKQIWPQLYAATYLETHPGIQWLKTITYCSWLCGSEIQKEVGWMSGAWSLIWSCSQMLARAMVPWCSWTPNESLTWLTVDAAVVWELGGGETGNLSIYIWLLLAPWTLTAWWLDSKRECLQRLFQEVCMQVQSFLWFHFGSSRMSFFVEF